MVLTSLLCKIVPEGWMVSYYELPENFPTKEEKFINKTTKL